MFHPPSKLSAAIGLIGWCLVSATTLAGVPTTAYVSATEICSYPTIQAAVDDLAPGSEIRLVGVEFVLGSPLSIFNRDLRIAGGYPSCDAKVSSAKTTLLADFSGDAVISVGGNVPNALNLELRDLVITGGDNLGGNGGGLRVTGLGQVNLIAVDVHANLADYGGGMYVQALLGGPLAVNLIGGTRIGDDSGVGNASELGGGVFCWNARMRLGQVDIMSNGASDRGGGLFADTCEILSTEEDGDLRIEANRARDGAGIYATGASELILRSRPHQRISISHNEAVVGAPPQAGGGLSLVGMGTRFEASGVRIDDNIARSFGGGIRVAGAEVILDRGLNSCAPSDLACSSLSGNQVLDEIGVLSGFAAAAFVAGSGAPLLSIRQTRIVGNAANSDILRAGSSAALELSNVLVADNQSTSSLIHNGSSATLTADFLTVADNLFSGALFQNLSTAPLALDVKRSILLVEAGGTHLSGAGTTAFSCLNTGPGGALGGTPHAPGFFDASNGQYRLRSDSPNLDQCAIDGTETPFDLAGRPRVVDRPGIPNGAGPIDRGAFEDVEDLFSDRFED